MLDVNTLKPVFADKLAETGSLDAAFLKCIWIAYKQGIEDANKVIKYSFLEDKQNG